ncbi:serine/threonine protein kinase [Nocardia amikacinitolerans]|uniref:serine/threonine-protein kinase n=1 Tax=Nocardia amikacinitolerans TaxID=756689 RepID=UPI0020A47380|nr:serine/threonine-protein kinase [Nocardia amikacinitolerans]MCP2296394.1 serine/threonine protein kinase [Nocardia amikacinitolerans]
MLDNGAVFAGYTVERLLGRGGMGSVYLARHPRLPRWTALKLLNRELFFDTEIRARFEREADLVAQLDHPNIVTVFDRGVEGEQLWISMQYVDGVDAASLDASALPPRRAVQIVAETAKALDFAHGKGVLHRDVKPANILLERAEGGLERVFLTDFGIARFRDDTGKLTQTGTFTATLAFASPEQLSGAVLDHRSDQYSLACSLFRMLTGTVPFEASNPVAVIQGHMQQPPPRLGAVRPGLPPALDAVLSRALAKRPDDRFDSCAEFAEAARRALADPGSGPFPLADNDFDHRASVGSAQRPAPTTTPGYSVAAEGYSATPTAYSTPPTPGRPHPPAAPREEWNGYASSPAATSATAPGPGANHWAHSSGAGSSWEARPNDQAAWREYPDRSGSRQDSAFGSAAPAHDVAGQRTYGEAAGGDTPSSPQPLVNAGHGSGFVPSSIGAQAHSSHHQLHAPGVHGRAPFRSRRTAVIGTAVGATLALLATTALVLDRGSAELGASAPSTSAAEAAPSTQRPAKTSAAPTTSKNYDDDALVDNIALISKAFPGMTPEVDEDNVVHTGPGHNGSTCFAHDEGSANAMDAGAPDFGGWTAYWYCFGGPNKASYQLFVYRSPEDVQAAVDALPAHTRSTAEHGRESYTNYLLDGHPAAKRPRMITVFTGAKKRENFLMYSVGFIATMDEFMNWWRTAPLS